MKLVLLAMFFSDAVCRQVISFVFVKIKLFFNVMLFINQDMLF